MKRFLPILLLLAFVVSAQAQFGKSVAFRASAAKKPAAGGGGGGGDFLTGISLRYVADDVTGSDGDPVALWPDSSGNHFGLTPEASSPPILKVSVVNSHKAVQFNGLANTTSTNISPTVLGTATATTIFIVMKQTGSQAQNTVLGWEAGDGKNFEIHATYDDVIYFDFADTSGARVNGSQPAGWDDAWHVLECYRSGATMTILVDGVQIATRADASGNWGTTGSQYFNVGAKSTGGSIPFKGQIAEIRLYPTAVGSTDRATIRTYLKGIYGTP